MSHATRTSRFAALGGFLGAVVMSIILTGSKVMMGLPAMTDFIVMDSFASAHGEGVSPAKSTQPICESI